MKILVTGGAGFIGSNLCHFLTNNKPLPLEELVVIDNLSLGQREFIFELIAAGTVTFYEEDLLNFEKILSIFAKHKFDLVCHLAANSDIGYGAEYTDWDLKQGALATYHVLECMKRTGAKKIVFSSTSAIYGEASLAPTLEDYGPLFPISFYGASKLAAEGLISSFCHNFGLQAWIYRFGNIVGKNGTHGVMVDFVKKLKQNPAELQIFGNGEQAKPYLYVQDCIDGMLFGFLNSTKQLNFFNLACAGATLVKEIAEIVIKQMQLPDVTLRYTGGERGWPGDVAQVRLDTQKLAKLGWQATHTSTEAVAKAAVDLVQQT